MNLQESKRLRSEAENLIIGAGQGHKRPGSLDYPRFIERRKGCRIWDVDGNEYVDYLMAFGLILLGYGYDAVDTAAKAQMLVSLREGRSAEYAAVPPDLRVLV